MTDSNIDKYYYLEGDAKCGGDLKFGPKKDLGDTKKFLNDHVYEKQTLARFFEWLGDGDLTPIGMSMKPQSSWVAEVLLDENNPRNHELHSRNTLLLRRSEIAEMEGPVGSDGDKLGRFGQSRAWIDLGNSEKHFNDFIIICRPEIVTVPDPAGGPFDKPYDVVRKYHMFQPHTLEKFIEQENSEEIGGDWEKVPTPRTMAITQRDAPPTGGRKRIAEFINFHPLWIKFQRSRNFGGWIEDDFTEVTKLDALEDFKSKGAAKKPPVDTRPMDGLLSKSLTANMLHEFFHLSYFGNMLDAPNAYGWMNNVKNNNRENPDLYAIIGAVIELMNRDGQRYSVSAEGEVSPMS
ncbi:hypothetical protein CGCVW01_v005339 [Colletotrichum viniferum]|nr:hypothetical protein CGCVW01_v005339 [Colletotrichum viniferum]